MSDDIKRIDAAEFRELGYLQEVNRTFLHPLGLALEVVKNEDGSYDFGGVWDYRDDPEGIVFGDTIDGDKAERIAEEWDARAPARKAKLGFIVQPVSATHESDETTGVG